MSERIYLDPSEEATDRTELDITDWVAKDGINWGDAQIESYMADQQVGSVPVDFTVPNRQVTIPLVLKDSGGTAFATIRSSVQAKAALWQKQGGYLKRVLSSGGTVFADVVNATLRLSGDWLQANADVDVNAALTLECIPDFYGAEETLSDHSTTTAAELIFTETTENGGDFPLGDRVRVVVDEDDAENQRGLIWAFRGKHYSAATTAQSEYEAEELEALDTTRTILQSGASGGTVVNHGTVSTNWTPIVGTNIGGTSWMTHTGTNRIYARVFSGSGTAVEARLVYDVGDLVNPIENPAQTLYAADSFHILNLGEVRLDPPSAGAHRWQGQIQARGQDGDEAIAVDKVWIVNQDESAGVLHSGIEVGLGPLTSFSAVDTFSQTAGNLNGKTAVVGGAWATTGAAGDFQVSGSGSLTRATTSDSNVREATVGPTNLTDVVVAVDFKWGGNQPQDATDMRSELAARTGPIVEAKVFVNGDGEFRIRLASSDAVERTIPGFAKNTTYTLTLACIGSFAAAWIRDQGADLGEPDVTISDIGTGAAAFSLVDENPSTESITRTYDNFRAWSPSSNAVVFASQSAQLATGGIIREDSGGTAYGQVPLTSGDLPRMPNQSSAGTVEFFAKASRGDLETLADSGIDDISAQIVRRPSYLTTPN